MTFGTCVSLAHVFAQVAVAGTRVVSFAGALHGTFGTIVAGSGAFTGIGSSILLPTAFVKIVAFPSQKYTKASGGGCDPERCCMASLNNTQANALNQLHVNEHAINNLQTFVVNSANAINTHMLTDTNTWLAKKIVPTNVQ